MSWFFSPLCDSTCKIYIIIQRETRKSYFRVAWVTHPWLCEFELVLGGFLDALLPLDLKDLRFGWAADVGRRRDIPFERLFGASGIIHCGYTTDQPRLNMQCGSSFQERDKRATPIRNLFTIPREFRDKKTKLTGLTTSTDSHTQKTHHCYHHCSPLSFVINR